MHQSINKFNISSLILLVSFLGCQPTKNNIPKTVIPQDSMAMIIEDILIMESGLSIAKNFGYHTDQLSQIYMDSIIKKHHTSKKRFKKSFSFYGQKPELMNEIYQKIIPSISEKQTRLSQKNKAKK